jgi:hypothetical protein
MSIDEKKTLVRQFLERCNRYADDKLDGYARQLADASGSKCLDLQDKIGHWTAYRAFNEHAIEELGTDRLDTWFEDPDQA